ncbi:MAG: bacteriohemerythrin [Terracidiphilus sp.]|nr:bacteriohemerythrin [Terracidiphilus sp.]
MSGLAWSHANLVGVQAMDDQHGILMDTVNELRAQMLRGEPRHSVIRQLERLIEFTGMHFSCEESLLDRNHYPGITAHRLEHQRLITEINRALELIQHGRESDLQPLLDFLHTWYVEHVEKHDRPYGAWLNSRGIE